FIQTKNGAETKMSQPLLVMLSSNYLMFLSQVLNKQNWRAFPNISAHPLRWDVCVILVHRCSSTRFLSHSRFLRGFQQFCSVNFYEFLFCYISACFIQNNLTLFQHDNPI